ncbi:hypothetical protein IC617_08900 [Neiella sp. HB171785]|uniref:LPP20 lipoprotein n=1 Tax=Neiella litorisoli TaxID=2771431 RepID=A0A8J6R2V2_9GAMM|nr:hypothetical protein [Neiella litorisoli]MBD1389545.1 hypothetical protein [Neiella litorisoli]
MHYKVLAIVGVGFALLSGCSSTPTAEDLVKQQADLEMLRAELAEERRELEQERLEQELEQAPDWMLDPPKADATGFYGVAMSTSSQYGMALRKAKVFAEFELAKQYEQELSGSERMFVQEGVHGDVHEQTTVLIDKLVADVSVVGYDVVSQEVRVVDGAYHAFVMLKLPYDEFNQVLKQRKSAAHDTTIKAAFDDLQIRLEQKRQREAERVAVAEGTLVEAEGQSMPDSDLAIATQ